MLSLLFRRLIRGVATIVLLSIIAFSVEHILPGNPAGAILGPEADPSAVKQLNHSLGFDKPLVVQYGNWAKQFVQGDFGEDYQSGVPVAHLLKTSAAPTAELAILALLLGIVVGIPIGIAAGYWRGRWPDAAISAVATLGIAVPSFWLGMMLVILFGVTWHLLPIYGYVPIQEGLGDNLKSIVLPVLSLAALDIAVIARFTRSGVVEVLGSDYVRTARAKGLSPVTVVSRHVLRNAMAVPLTVIGLIVGYTIGGVVTVEFLFSIPGLGKLAVDSVLSRELAVVQAVMMLSGIIVVLSNISVDIGYRLLDPRVEL